MVFKSNVVIIISKPFQFVEAECLEPWISEEAGWRSKIGIGAHGW